MPALMPPQRRLSPILQEWQETAPQPDPTYKDVQQSLLATARQRWTIGKSYWAKNWERMREDLEFVAGEQWDPKIAKDRADAQRPCLTVNKFPAFVGQIVNEARQKRPAIKVRPVGNGADVDTAKVFQGLCRHVESDSQADIAYETAHEYAVKAGLGWFRIRTAYESYDSFDKRVLIERIWNPFSVVADPGARQPDYSDMDWCFLIGSMSRGSFQATYDISPTTMGQWDSYAEAWVTRDVVQVAEYFTREWEDRTLVQFDTGQSFILEDLMEQAEDAGMTDAQFREDVLGRIVQQRKTKKPIIHWLKFGGYTILEASLWDGKYIPVIPVLGNEELVHGELIYSGIVRHARDPQRMKNFWVTRQAEVISQAPLAPWVIAAQQLENHETEWNNANNATTTYLTYNLVTGATGQPAPPPQRQVYEPPIQAISQAMGQADQDLFATTGIYRPSLGDQSNETSGKAILARDQMSDMSNYHFGDNLARAILHAGRILIDLLPKIMPPNTVRRILSDDGSSAHVLLKAGMEPGEQPTPEMEGIQGIYDITAGEYDVVVDVGPSYATKRQEAVDNIVKLAQADPQVIQLAGDLLVKAMDFEGAQEIADRIRRTMPPGVLDMDQSNDPKQQVVLLMAQLRQVTQEAQQLNAHASQVEQQLMKTAQENMSLKLKADDTSQDIALRKQELEMRHLENDAKHEDAMEDRRLEAARLGLDQAKFQAEQARKDHETLMATAQDADVAQRLNDLEQLMRQLLKMEEREQGSNISEGDM